MKMKAKIAVLGLLVLLSAGLGIAALSQPAPMTETEEPAAYTLRDYGGCVAVFREDEPSPLRITDIETETLNDADRRSLLEGIAVDSKNELLLLLEDLGS